MIPIRRLGPRARRIRESSGLSQRAAAVALGITNVHLCNIEQDRSLPSVRLLLKYRELWGTDPFTLTFQKE